MYCCLEFILSVNKLNLKKKKNSNQSVEYKGIDEL